jgi:hypothetical protein
MAFSRILQDLLEQDRFAKFTKTSNTTATLGSLTLDTAILGAGGLDTGSIAASTLYYVYTIVDSNIIKLIASISSTSPTGFTQYKKVGAFYTDTSSNIFKAYFYGEINQTVFSAKVGSTGTVMEENIDWINSNASNPSTGNYTITFNTSLFTVAPNCIATVWQPSGTRDRLLTITSISSTQILIQTSVGNGVAESKPFTITCQKQGIDAAQPDWSRI